MAFGECFRVTVHLMDELTSGLHEFYEALESGLCKRGLDKLVAGIFPEFFAVRRDGT